MLARERPKQGGFTLIELSIVIVIIGLIIGGIFAGRDLITAAKVRRQLTEWEQLQAAVNTFKLSYNCFPGDCATASPFGFVYDGNGDGFVSNFPVSPTYIDAFATVERCYFFIISY